MKLSPRITTVASSAVANLCLIPETGGERGRRQGAERRGVKLKPLGNGERRQAESNRCAMTKSREKDTQKKTTVARMCVCENVLTNAHEVPPRRRFMSHSLVTSLFII